MSQEKARIEGMLRETSRRVMSLARWILVILLVVYLLSGIYSISPNEIGVQQRFGKVIDDKVPPGIHYALPWPVDRVTKAPVRIVSSLLIDDFFSALERNSTARAFYNMTGLASYCVTGDNNLVNVQCVIQYTITQPAAFLFRVERPTLMLRSMACNAIIHCLARMPVDEILTRGKQAIGQFVKRELQARLDANETGLGVSFVELREIKPPDRVERFFSDVVKAQIDREKMINEAESYRNEKIPEAQAYAARLLQEAEAYRAETVLRAQGEAERFRRILDRVREGGDSARRTLYLESLRQIMEQLGRRHLVVPGEDGAPPVRLKMMRPPR